MSLAGSQVSWLWVGVNSGAIQDVTWQPMSWLYSVSQIGRDVVIDKLSGAQIRGHGQGAN